MKPTLLAPLAASLALAAAAPALAQAPARWKAHDMARPRPAVVKPPPQALPGRRLPTRWCSSTARASPSGAAPTAVPRSGS